MYIPATGQIVTAADTDPSGNGVITYIQSVNSLNGAGQTQVLMAVAEDDSPQMGNAVRIRAKEAAAIAGNLLGSAYSKWNIVVFIWTIYKVTNYIELFVDNCVGRD